MVSIKKRVTTNEVGGSRRDKTVRAFAVDVRRHGLGVENAKAVSMYQEQLIDKSRRLLRIRGAGDVMHNPG
jgi:hypothetical protein